MSNMNFITSIMHLPENSLKLNDDHTFLLTLPVKTHAFPHCQTQTLKTHDYRNQPVKTLLLSNTEFFLVYRRRRYRCPLCEKTFSEQNSFLSKYQRMSRKIIANILQEHGFLVTSTDIARLLLAAINFQFPQYSVCLNRFLPLPQIFPHLFQLMSLKAMLAQNFRLS